jgi:hypothetical protein
MVHLWERVAATSWSSSPVAMIVALYVAMIVALYEE